jgi:NAD(P)-dependent dehydrogenase (short-subunit alcohol dehydrogenase family)
MQFPRKVVLVAGGTGALGRAISMAFLDALAKVAVTYRRQEEFLELTNMAGEHASSLEGYEVDATNESAVHGLIDTIASKHGQLDIVVNAVGGYAGGTPLWEMDSKIFDQMVSLNLRSGYVLCRAAVPIMVKQKSGAIVNVASRAAIDHGRGASAYAASKAAAVAMIDSLAADLRGTGVRANSILPSIFDTGANRRAMPSADFAAWPKAEDIAKVVLFLCTDDAKLIQGAAIPVYGNL